MANYLKQLNCSKVLSDSDILAMNLYFKAKKTSSSHLELFKSENIKKYCLEYLKFILFFIINFCFQQNDLFSEKKYYKISRQILLEYQQQFLNKILEKLRLILYFFLTDQKMLFFLCYNLFIYFIKLRITI